MNWFEQIQFYMSFSFVQYALVVGVLISLCSSLLGVTLVLKRYSFIGDGLSHVAFGAMAVGTVLKLADYNLLVLPTTVIVAVVLLKSGSNTKVKGDAAIAMISVSSLAIGYLLMNVFSTSANVSGDVCSTLFGSTSILTITRDEMWLSVVLSILVMIAFVVYYNKIFAVTFDENFAKATGVKAERYNLLIAVAIAVVIVLGMNLVGSLLISALVIFPALAAMNLINHFKGVVVCSAVISVICSILGTFVSILYSTPVGATIVATDLVAYLICAIIGVVKRLR